jgi:hypothetical protein
MIVNSSRGGGSKDTWVLEGVGEDPGSSTPRGAAREFPPMPDLAQASWTSQQQQQQQRAL